MNPPKKRPTIVCRCNNVSRETIEEAIRDGCQTMNQIFDATSAGVGPCGGSCRRLIVPMLQDFLENGDFTKSQNASSQNQCAAPPKKGPTKPD